MEGLHGLPQSAGEIETAGGEPSIRDQEGVKACVDAPKASFGGEFLHDLFEMAESYIACLTMRHPFVDGNKRTALASALTFLYLNGYSIEESYDDELADLVLNFVTKKDIKNGCCRTFQVYSCSTVI